MNALGQDSLKVNQFFIKFAPLSAVAPYVGPSVRIGAEYRFQSNWAVYSELGTFFYSSRGLTSKFEFKRYYNLEAFANRKEMSANYVSAEIYYKYQAYDTYDSIEPNLDQGEPGMPKMEYSVSKHVECFSIKYGRLRVFKCGLTIDAFIGLGVRFKQARNTLSPEDNSNMPETSDYGPNLYINKAGNFIYPNFDAGVKIGWRIK